MNKEWRWNDESIDPGEAVFRHVPRALSPKKRIDPTSGQWSLTKAAFTDAEMREDGWSIYRDGLLRHHRLTKEDIENSGDEPREAWTFKVGDVRAIDGCGVIDEVDESTGRLGLAHGLVRCDDPKPEKKKVVMLRNYLINRAEPA